MTELRPYRPEDRADVYRVCLLTGDSGVDATGKFSDDTLLPDIYAGPYLELEPELATVVDVGGRVAGYLLAAADTLSFVERYRSAWLPGFAARHPLPPLLESAEDRLVDLGHHPERMIKSDQDRYPTHLHIDLLPELQRQGLGRALMRRLLDQLRERGIPGVQLGVGPDNVAAQTFYARLGFHRLPGSPDNPYALALESDAEL
ncbi:N-acetyltransferase [Gryllotalpicola daejeonensis]|uniref:N-acetyltransferase n=1 Tax=Gryllotalpicola daejeonensis TaxID=993087 RepID=A0ABP7ZJN8_9MICO